MESLGDSWQPVTLEYLKFVHDTVNSVNPVIQTFGETVEVLEYLHEHGAVNLELIDKTYRIRKAIYNGSQ